jgi:tetratricopeptide (TPR) repeat protein
MDKIKVLFLAANPTETAQLKLDEEIRSITQKIRASEYRDSLKLISAWAVHPDDLLQLLNEHKPHIIHFSGHASETGEIILVDNTGLPKKVSAKALKVLVTTLKDNIRAIVLNTCYSEIQAKAITEVIDCAVGMSAAIGDSAAITFAASFYRAVGFGRSAKEAFDQGIASLLIEGIYSEEDNPQLVVKDGIDPSRVFFLTDSYDRVNAEQADIDLSISISNDFSEDGISNTYGFVCNEPDRTLTYEVDYDNQEMRIIPKMQYLENLHNGNPIADLGMILNIPPYFKWQFPNLDLRLVNNSNKTVYITDIFIDIEESILDPYPVLVIPGEEPNALHVLLVNDGWGDVLNAIVRFNLIPKGYPITFDGVYENEICVGNFADSYNLDLSAALQSIGVDVDFINGFNSYGEQYQSIHQKMGRSFGNFKEFIKNKQDEDYKRLINALGIFQYSDKQSRLPFPAVVYGEISFAGGTLDRVIKSHVVKFSSEFTLLVPGGYGAPGSPSYQYAAKLDIDRQKYQVRVQGNGSSVSQYLKPGDVDRFNIRLGVMKSSLHKFSVRLVYNDNQSILTLPISLKIFVPKSEADSVRGMDDLRVEQGKQLASQGDVDGAINKFNEALRYNSSLELDPSRESQKLAAPSLVTKGDECVKNSKLIEAIESYVKAKRFDPALEISAYSWNIEEVERVNERILIANSLCENLVRADGHCIVWQPQGDIPNILEVLIWLWVVYPSMWQTIAIAAPQKLKNAIDYYNSQ